MNHAYQGEVCGGLGSQIQPRASQYPLFLHAQHAAAENYQAILLVADDTNVFIVRLSLSSAIKCEGFIRRRTLKARVRMIDIPKISAALGHEVCSALPGLHAWTGCDTISALASQGKMKVLKIEWENQKCRDAFFSLGASWNLPQDVFNHIQEFTCQLYSKNTKICGVNVLRCNMVCARKRDVESGQPRQARTHDDSTHLVPVTKLLSGGAAVIQMIVIMKMINVRTCINKKKFPYIETTHLFRFHSAWRFALKRTRHSHRVQHMTLPISRPFHRTCTSCFGLRAKHNILEDIFPVSQTPDQVRPGFIFKFKL